MPIGSHSVIRLPDFSSLTHEKSPDETGSFAKSSIDAQKIYKVLSCLRPFSNRSSEEIMEFICYMFEKKGGPGDAMCQESVRSYNFYFIASGELLYRRSGPQRIEQKLFESDFWGLECLFTGRDDRVSVTVTTQCRLFVLTARRFFWLCKMSAQRTLQLQMVITEKLANKLDIVRHTLGLSPLCHGKEEKSHAIPITKANTRLLNRMLHAFRQLEVPPARDTAPPIHITLSSGERVIVYVLTGCVKVATDDVVPQEDHTLMAGEFQEVSRELGNADWYIKQGSVMETCQTLIYLIRIKPYDRVSDCTTD